MSDPDENYSELLNRLVEMHPEWQDSMKSWAL